MYIGNSDNLPVQLANYNDIANLIGKNALTKYVYSGTFTVQKETIVPVPINQNNESELMFIHIIMTKISGSSGSVTLYNNSDNTISKFVGLCSVDASNSTPQTSFLIGAKTYRYSSNTSNNPLIMRGTNYFLYNGYMYSDVMTVSISYTAYFA